MGEGSFSHELIGHDPKAFTEFWVFSFFSLHRHDPAEVFQVVYLSFYLANEMNKFIQFSFHILTLQNRVSPILMIHDVIANRNHHSFDHILGLTAWVSLGNFLGNFLLSFWDLTILRSSLLYS